MKSSKLEKGQEAAVLRALRDCCGAIEDLVEESGAAEARYPDLAPNQVKEEEKSEGTGVEAPKTEEEELAKEEKGVERKRKKRDQGKEKEKKENRARKAKEEKSQGRR